MHDQLASAVQRVVRNGNCCGCGGCALLSSQIDMKLDEAGNLRPTVATTTEDADRGGICGGDPAWSVGAFERMCPGRRVTSPTRSARLDSPVFGPYVSAWRAWAINPDVRRAGSSGGVLTALSSLLLESDINQGIVASRMGDDPRTTVPLTITTKEEALASAGSRYAPVSNLSLFDPRASDRPVVAKPCEVTAARQLMAEMHIAAADQPLLLSFFCAGTPSQNATDKLVQKMGFGTSELTEVRYRGDGWPGSFRAQSKLGEESSMTYHESWGKHLGRDLPWRCKICVDGTGGHSDVAVGDYWYADESGYPMFSESDGVSVAIARTERGHDLLMRAAQVGVVHLEPVDIESVRKIQPLQDLRKRALIGRLVGRLLAQRRIPSYKGYGLARLALRNPTVNLRAAAGTFRRSIRRNEP